MLEVMDRLLKKRNFFSGNSMEKEDAGRRHEEFYCEGQRVSGHDDVREEQDLVIMKEKRRSRFFANYNMFF
jgi:hypothetical protein